MPASLSMSLVVCVRELESAGLQVEDFAAKVHRVFIFTFFNFGLHVVFFTSVQQDEKLNHWRSVNRRFPAAFKLLLQKPSQNDKREKVFENNLNTVTEEASIKASGSSQSKLCVNV